MKRKVTILALLLISSALTFGFHLLPRLRATEVSDKVDTASPKTIWVPDNFTSIQEAIDNASSGDAIRVRAGTYYEHVVVNKPLVFIGEDRSTTIIDGNGTGTVVNVTANNVDISGFTIRNGGGMVNNTYYAGFGIYSQSSGSVHISDNIVTNNLDGIYLYNSQGNIISGNVITSTYVYGITLICSGGNILRDNNMTNNRRGLVVDGDSLQHFINDIDISNTIDGKLVYYWVNQHNRQIPANAGYVAIVNSTNIIVRDLNMTEDVLIIYTTDSIIENISASKHFGGIYLLSSNNITIRGNNITKNAFGLFMQYSNRNVIVDNTISGNLDGIFLDHSSNNTINGNIIVSNVPWPPGFGYGIFARDSHGNKINGNTISNNSVTGIDIMGSGNIINNNTIINNSWTGVCAIGSSNTISGNIIKNGSIGISVGGSKNIILGNIVTNNHRGITLYSNNNTIYHNNFINNTYPVYSYEPVVNIWDDGYPSGGNYWSDYNGTDSDQDGIGDTPYIIDDNNTDNYPLMGMFSDFLISSIFDVKLEKTYHVTTISNSTIINFGLYPIIDLNTGKWVGGTIVLDVTGPEGTKGFIRFTIPKDLLDCPEGLECWVVCLNFTDVTSSCHIWENSTHTFIYVPYNHSVQEIMVRGTWIVPEFPSALILPLLMIITLVAVVLRKAIWTER